MTQENSEHSPTAPPQRRLRWAPPPSRTAPDASESTPRIRVDLPRFTGDDPVGWIFKTQKYFDYFYTSDKDRLNLVGIWIAEPAAKWYRYFLSGDPNASWTDFLYAFKQRFDPDHLEEPESELYELVPQPPPPDTTSKLEPLQFPTDSPHSITTSEEIAQVGTISAKGDELIAPAMENIGTEGVLTIADGKTWDNELEVVEGMQLDKDYISPYSITNQTIGVQTIQNALQTPVHPIASDAEVAGAVVVGKLLETDASDQRTLLVHGASHDQWRIAWPNGSPDSWESVTVIQQHFSSIHLEDKVISEDGGVDTYVRTALTTGRTPRIRQQPTRFAEYVT